MYQALLLICLLCATTTLGQATSGRIAFYSDRDGNYEIYSVNPDGSGLKRLTNHEAEDQCPSWSPDGKRVAFRSRRNGNSDIFIMNADGSDVRASTTAETDEYHPAWSPDGKELVFHAHRRDDNWNIYIINIEI
jgi:TolB protein